MRIMELVSGNTISSAAGIESIYFGTQSEFSPPLVVLEVSAVGTDPANASPTTIYANAYLFKCQAKFPDVDFKALAAGEFVVDFDAYKSVVDEKGNTIPAAFGRYFAGGASLPA